MSMRKYSFVALLFLVSALLCTPARLLAQTPTVTLGGTAAVASAEDFATRTFQDPWDMNERTDLGWFLYGSDNPSPDLTNGSVSGGNFSPTTGTSPNLFLLETGIPFAARLGKTGGNYPIDTTYYRMLAIRMNINGAPQSVLTWNRNNLWDGSDTSSNTIQLTPGWRTYLVDMPTL